MEQITIVITESAYDDLEDIENHISQDSPAIARGFISKIFDKIIIFINIHYSASRCPK